MSSNGVNFPNRQVPANATYLRSTFYEQLVEHVFISEVLQEAWYGFGQTVEVLRSEIDASGYDVVFECNGIVRHVQLKTSAFNAKASRQKVNIALAVKPSGCVVWIVRHEDHKSARMTLSYRFFGGTPGSCLPDVERFPIAKHTKGDAAGTKKERPNIRVVPKRDFVPVATTKALIERLFGVMPPIDNQALAVIQASIDSDEDSSNV